MYRHIYVPVDNSECSTRAIDVAIGLGKAFGAKLTGSHVYAARLHTSRFKQMEYTLPEDYRAEPSLERQRRTHEALIALGLRLISDSYLEVAAGMAAAAGVPFERKTIDGRHYKALVADVRASDYDLAVLGALGMGAGKDSQLGSVALRFVRGITTDALIVRDVDPAEAPGGIVVGLDGSPQSFHALRLGVGFAKARGEPLHAVAVYDPYLHYVMFNGIVKVLSAEAARVFHFEEQERLHEEIIDTGLAKIYQAHLEIGRKLAAAEGVDLGITLLAGKCSEKILDFVRKARPWLLVLGRLGVHADDDTELGSNAEHLLRLAPCSVLLTGGRFDPPVDVRAGEMIAWTEEAEARMDSIPPAVRGLARAALLRYAVEQGHTVVTSALVGEAMALFMRDPAAERMRALAADVAVARLRAEPQAVTAICSVCGYAAREPQSVASCPVCRAGAEKFHVISQEVVEARAAREGGASDEEPLPGVRVRWSAEARAALNEVRDAHLRGRAKAQVEKHVRLRKMPVITRDLAIAIIEEIAGRRP